MINSFQPRFHIERLQCGYTHDKVVLSVEQLAIPRGQLTFIVGASGLGKSTLLEALGLMSRTMFVRPETRVDFYLDEAGAPQSLVNIWAEGDELLAKFRRDHYSFVFQSTNLMPNFTAGENMCFSALISGTPPEEAKKNVLETMKVLGLHADLFDRKTTALSGGQRQRVAFIRAIHARHEVLFGDEPTGNLDADTARRLLFFLKQQLSEKQQTGIIVSHDIKLALEFGDMVVPITPNLQSGEGTHRYGVILSENLLFRHENHWKNTDGNAIENPEKKVQSLLKPPMNYE